MTDIAWYGQRGEFEPDPFTYDPPKELRGKLAHYFGNKVEEAIRDIQMFDLNEKIIPNINKWLSEALGVPEIPRGGHFGYRFQDFVYSADAKECIRAVEVLLNFFHNLYYNAHKQHAILRDGDWIERTHKMIDEVNWLFRSYLCGYQAEVSDGAPFIKVFRADSEFLHTETVRRPLSLLRETDLSGPARQFEDAVKEWTEGNYADAITDANSAFEAVMKFILGRDSGTAAQLVKELAKRGILPPYLEGGASQLVNLMEMLPRLRDAKSDAHGRLRQEQIPNYARLAINLAGSLIVFLVEEWKTREVTDKK